LVLPSSGGWTSFSGGIYQTAVGINNQKLLVWGGNVYGALGNGYTGSGVDTNIPQDYDPTPTTPIQNSSYPPGGNSFTNIVLSAVGDNYHGLALDTYGHVWAWGDDEYGQLGINGGPAKCGTTISCSWKNTSLPYGEEFCGGAICEIYLTEVLNSSGSCCLSNIVAIATGRRDSYAIDSSGHVWAWGDNTWGQLGYSSSFPNQGPVKYSYTCYETDSSGTLIGELTPGYPINYSPLPVEVRDSTGAPFNVGTPSQAQIAVGEDDVLVIKSDGSVWTWGEGGDGLGIGVTTGPDTYTTSPYYQEVVNADGSTTCQSTTSTFDYAPYSVEVNNTNNSCCLSLLSLSGGITTPQVAAWTDQPTFIVLANTGKIYSWGSNEWGMLGDGSTSSSSYPVEVTNF
jgi:alpha-tubulin suppressor-like RCC1 family protein